MAELPRTDAEVLWVSFSQSASHLIIVYTDLVKIFKTTPYKFEYHSAIDVYRVTHATCLEPSGDRLIVCTLSEENPTRMDIWEIKDKKTRHAYHTFFEKKVVGMTTDKANPYVIERVAITKLTIVAWDKIRYFRLKIVDNPHGVCAVSKGGLIAHPQFDSKGRISLFCTRRTFSVHTLLTGEKDSQLMTFDDQGGHLAVANSRGTKVRVYQLNDLNGVLVFNVCSDFSRITSIDFDPRSALLAVASDIYGIKLYKTKEHDEECNTHRAIQHGSIKNAFGSILPKFLREKLMGLSDFVTIHSSENNGKNKYCIFGKSLWPSLILCYFSNGIFRQYLVGTNFSTVTEILMYRVDDIKKRK